MITYLFVPAHDGRKVTKALASPADAVILDLEDAVPEQMKAEARAAAAQVLRERDDAATRLWVRVNGPGTQHHGEDLRVARWERAAGVVLPKAEDRRSIAALSGLGLRGLLLILETAVGLSEVAALVNAAPVAPRLALGTFDLAADLGLTNVTDPDESEVVWHVRCQLVLDSRRLRLPSPVDGVFPRIGDTAGLETIAARVRRLGFGAKLAIHPEQLAVIQRAFDPDAGHLAEARELIDAYEHAEREGLGAVNFRGQMIDRVHVERARALLARHSVGGRA